MMVMGKRFLFAAACLLLSTALSAQFRTGSGAYDDLYDSETVHAFKEHVSYLSSAAWKAARPGPRARRTQLNMWPAPWRSTGWTSSPR